MTHQQRVFSVVLLAYLSFISPAQANEEKMKWTFQNMEVKVLLHSLAEIGQHNLVVAEGVVGPISLHLKDMTWREALDVVVQAKGLVVSSKNGVLWVNARSDTSEPLQALAIGLKYAKAVDIAQRLQSASTGGAGGAGAGGLRWLSARGSVMAEPRTNQLFFLDTPAALKQLQDVIQWLDIPVRQVMIEARIVEASDTFGKSLGVRLGGSDLRGVRGGDPGYSFSGSNRLALGGTYNAVSATTGESSGTLDTTNTTFVNLPAVGQGGYNAATFAISLFSSAANRFLNLELSALEADGKGKLVSSPRIVTADQTKVLEPGYYVYDIVIKDLSDNITRLFDGMVQVTPGVTQWTDPDVDTPEEDVLEAGDRIA